MVHEAVFCEDPDERLQLLRLLLVDRDWSCTPPVRRRLQGLLARPPICREASWLLLAEEIAAYLAFRKRWTTAHNQPGTGAGCRFTRKQWEREGRPHAA